MRPEEGETTSIWQYWGRLQKLAVMEQTVDWESNTQAQAQVPVLKHHNLKKRHKQ